MILTNGPFIRSTGPVWRWFWPTETQWRLSEAVSKLWSCVQWTVCDHEQASVWTLSPLSRQKWPNSIRGSNASTHFLYGCIRNKLNVNTSRIVKKKQREIFNQVNKDYANVQNWHIYFTLQIVLQLTVACLCVSVCWCKTQLLWWAKPSITMG